MTKLAVSEIFGPTIQGEGRHAGELAVFLRLAGCSLRCSWCDTPYTWAFGRAAEFHRDKRMYSREDELRMMTPFQVLTELDRLVRPRTRPRLVLTGGEPMLQKKALESMMVDLFGLFGVTHIDVETAGTIAPFDDELVGIYYTVSPKLASSGNSVTRRRNLNVLTEYVQLAEQGKADFKFVIVSEEDLEEVLHLQSLLNIPRDRIWLMPEGITVEAIAEGLQKVAPIALECGFNVSSRLQIEIWGNKRGV